MKVIVSSLIFIMLSMAAYAESECDYSVQILMDSNQFEPEEFKFKIRALRVEGPSTNITAQIIITNNGSIIKNYKPWTNSAISKQKTSNEYSPNLKEGVYEIKAEISMLCSDFSKENNIDERNMLIKTSLNNSQEIMIEKETEKAMQNPSIIILESYNHNETNSEIANNKNNPIEETKTFQQENKKTNKIIYESSNEKAKDLILIMLLAISIILNIILIWKR